MNEFDTELSITYAENETKEQQLANVRLMLMAGSTIAAVVIFFLTIFAYRRNKHMKHLKSVNQQLQDAYGKIEETT